MFEILSILKYKNVHNMFLDITDPESLSKDKKFGWCNLSKQIMPVITVLKLEIDDNLVHWQGLISYNCQ